MHRRDGLPQRLAQHAVLLKGVLTPEEVRLITAPLLDAVAETFPLLLEGAPDAFMSEVARRFTPPDRDGEPTETK